jgi:hypothetical protein
MGVTAILAVGVIVLTVVALNRLGGGDNSGCRFVNATEGAAVYSQPVLADSLIFRTIDRGDVNAANRLREPFVFILFDDDGGWALLRDGILEGECDDLPVDDTPLADEPETLTAIVLDGAQAWTTPGVKTGETPIDAPAGALAEIIAGPLQAPITIGGDVSADWYLIHVGQDTLGWVRVDQLDFDGAP